MNQESDSFPAGVAEKLKTYVYRLIDPRNGETFYVGKGQGDRVFAHIREQKYGGPGSMLPTSSTAMEWTKGPRSRSRPRLSTRIQG